MVKYVVFVDYRNLNRRMKADCWPFPKIEETFEDISGICLFSILDLFSGFWEFRMYEECNEKTKFISKYDVLHFKAMSFGLKNMSSTLQRLMDQVLREFDFARCYLDDMVTFSTSMQENINHLHLLLAAAK